MGIVPVARPIVSFHKNTDLISGYPSHKGSAKVYLLNPENSNLVRQGLGGRIGVVDFHLVLYHIGDAHSYPGEVVLFLRVVYHCQRPNLAQELAQPCGISYHC